MENPEFDVVENVLTRRTILNKDVELLENRISGRDNSFLPFICGKDGRISHRKLTQTINELIDGPTKYKDYRYDIQSYCNTRIDREIYSCFFFCAMLGIANYDEEEKCVIRSSEYFSDITDMAAHENNLFLAFNPALLYKCEVKSYFEDAAEGLSRKFTEYSFGGFFRNCDVAYHILTGRHITDALPSDEREKLFDEYFQKEAENYGFSSYDEYSKCMKENIDEEFDAEVNPDADSCDIFDESEIIARQKKKNEDWLKNCPFPDEFAEKYLRFRELFFEKYGFFRREFFGIAQTMVDMFLYAHGLSYYSDEDAFAYADSKLDGLISTFVKRGSGSDR